MFEHVRNHRELFKRIHGWLNPGGKLFTHVFCHRSTSYPFEVEGEDDWMSKHFLAEEPCLRMSFSRISGQLELEHRWRWSGEHYAKTSEDWVRNIDNARSEILQLFNRELSMVEAHRTFYRWRIFFSPVRKPLVFAMDRNGGLVIIYSKRHESSDPPSYSSPFSSIHFRQKNNQLILIVGHNGVDLTGMV